MNKLKISDPAGSLNPESRMPVLFVGHGSPMNAIEDNEFTSEWITTAGNLPKPKAILCISAHWETRGTFVTAMEQPATLHDFGGFPRELFEVRYPAPGSPGFADETRRMVVKTAVGADHDWGLDHGCWSVLCRMYPAADIPVFQLSLDYTQSVKYHYELAKELSNLRNKGVLILGSGNMVHNLKLIAWNKIHQPGFGFDWAVEASEQIKKCILDGNHDALIHYSTLGKAIELAIPSPEHFLPLLYALALRDGHDSVRLFNDKPVMGSLTMTSVIIG